MAYESASNANGFCYHALRLKPGEKIRESLLKYVENNRLEAAFVMSCVGSVNRATIRLANATADVYKPNDVLELKECFEILSLVGTLSAGGHLHVSLGDKDGKVVGGHVMGDMIVFTTAEIIIGNCEGLVFNREMDRETGFKELVISKKL